MNRIRRILSVFAAAAALCLAAIPAPGDTIRLKDGRTLEGSVTRELNGYVWFKFKIGELEQERMFAPDEIIELKKGDAPKAPGAEDPAGDAGKDEAQDEKKDEGAEEVPADFNPNVPRIAILTLEGTVGIQMSATPLENAIAALEKDKVNVVVLKFNSGGGMIIEIQRISDVIHNQYKSKFRTVAWIESAISAAAMSAHCIEEIYFMPNGNYGACTGFSGAGNAVKGRGLEEILYMMEKISARGGYHPGIMRAMQIGGRKETLQELQLNPPPGELSVNIDPVTGEVKWFQDTSGQYVISPGSFDVLTFNAPDALKYKFSKGTHLTHDELARAMGYTEYTFVGKPHKQFAWPVSAAEEIQIAWREGITEAQANVDRHYGNFESAIAQAASSTTRQMRGSFVAKARTSLNVLKTFAKKYPVFRLLYPLTDDWFKMQEERLKDLSR